MFHVVVIDVKVFYVEISVRYMFQFFLRVCLVCRAANVLYSEVFVITCFMLW